MNEYYLIALSLAVPVVAGTIVFIMGNWRDWRHPQSRR